MKKQQNRPLTANQIAEIDYRREVKDFSTDELSRALDHNAGRCATRMLDIAELEAKLKIARADVRQFNMQCGVLRTVIDARK